MGTILFSGFIAVLIATISNLIVIKTELNNLKDILMISIYILPLQFLIGLFFTYYYNKSNEIGLSYPLVLIMVYGIGIGMALVSQYFILGKDIKLLDWVSMFIISFGIVVYIIGKFYYKV